VPALRRRVSRSTKAEWIISRASNPAREGIVGAREKMFFDPSLSASGTVSCSSCHDPKLAYGPPNALPVQLAGKNMGNGDGGPCHLCVICKWSLHLRNIVSMEILAATAAAIMGRPAGSPGTAGSTVDGDQARIPLLSPYEMTNDNPAAVVARVRKASYAADFQNLMADRLAGKIEEPFNVILEALEAWEQDPNEFYPYSSKYDACLAGKSRLNEQELRGLKLFRDPDKGNCARWSYRDARRQWYTPSIHRLWAGRIRCIAQ
jgi:cytochrome c peroxidase